MSNKSARIISAGISLGMSSQTIAEQLVDAGCDAKSGIAKLKLNSNKPAAQPQGESVLQGKMLSMAEVAKLMNVSKITIQRWIKTSAIPKPCKIGGRCLRWPEKTISEWIQSGCKPQW